MGTDPSVSERFSGSVAERPRERRMCAHPSLRRMLARFRSSHAVPCGPLSVSATRPVSSRSTTHPDPSHPIHRPVSLSSAICPTRGFIGRFVEVQGRTVLPSHCRWSVRSATVVAPGVTAHCHSGRSVTVSVDVSAGAPDPGLPTSSSSVTCFADRSTRSTDRSVLVEVVPFAGENFVIDSDGLYHRARVSAGPGA
ncbi:hypothetical protein amrb99_98090 [Actinomadura sp. RB99]|nr:hypothetical protein [Actinomadura sp. RB99]